MKVAVIIVGIGQWEEYTEPLILSIQKHEPAADIIVVDNGGHYSDNYVDRVIWCAIDEIVCYAAAINTGIFALGGDEDWIIILNNDVICDAPFFKYLEQMDLKAVYGNTLHRRRHPQFMAPVRWIDGWIYAIPSSGLLDWDEEFKIAGFEDADYCFRARKLGFSIQKSDLPFTHLEYHIRKTFDNYRDHRIDNMKYLMRKHGLKRA